MTGKKLEETTVSYNIVNLALSFVTFIKYGARFTFSPNDNWQPMRNNCSLCTARHAHTVSDGSTCGCHHGALQNCTALSRTKGAAQELLTAKSSQTCTRTHKHKHTKADA